MKLALVLTAALAAGCATQEWVWDKAGSSQQEFNMDAGQCRAQAFGVPVASTMQVAMVYGSCMQGKGWQQRPR